MYTHRYLRSVRLGVRLCAFGLLLGLTNCGTNLDEILFQATASAGRSFLDIIITDIANDLADALEDGRSPLEDDDDDDGENEGEDDDDNDDGDGDDGDGDDDDDDEGDGDGDGAIDAGQAIYVANNCSACHCEDALGGCALESPTLVGAEREELDEHLRGDAPHTGGKFALTDEELTQLQLYLESLDAP